MNKKDVTADTLPYPVIRFFEEPSSHFRVKLGSKDFFAVSQCGFPDITLCKPLLGSCRCFVHPESRQKERYYRSGAKILLGIRMRLCRNTFFLRLILTDRIPDIRKFFFGSF
jgi:hypothetical protein